MNVHTLQTQEFDNGELVMMLHINAHFSRLKPGNVIEITFLTPTGEENSWDANNVEYHDATNVRAALEAFDQRAANGGWYATDLGKNLNEILEAA